MSKVTTTILLGLLALSGTACGADSSGAKTSKRKDAAKAIAKKTEAKTDTTKPREVKLPKLVDLGANKCIPCKMMAPILDQLEKDFKGRMDVVVIDVWQNSAEGNKYKIRVIPTQIFYSPEGKELFRHEGFYSREDMLKKWKELGYDFEKGDQ